MMSQQVVGSAQLGQAGGNQSFANSQILNQQQLGIFKSGGPVRATDFGYKMDQYHVAMSNSNQMMGSRKAMSGQQKSYKRGGGSLGPSGSGTLRPGTAQKRPASPNTQGLVKGANGPSPYSLGLQTHHNNLISGSMGGVHFGNSGFREVKNRGGSNKPSSAPAKNRIRSQSPIDGQSHPQGSTQATNQAYVQKKDRQYVASAQQKMMSNTGGFSGIMQGQGMNMASN